MKVIKLKPEADRRVWTIECEHDCPICDKIWELVKMPQFNSKMSDDSQMQMCLRFAVEKLKELHGEIQFSMTVLEAGLGQGK